ncbi:MAG: T9SS type A sorting domain-containing protein [Bacteroidota bacterium]
MKKLYQLSLVTFCLIVSMQLNAQRIFMIPQSDDITMPADIFPVIMGDTTDTGERVDSNTIYKLENGAVYITSGRIVNKPGWKLHIEAVDLNNTDTKPIITRIPNASGTYPDIMRPEGDVTLKNLWIISGDRGADEQHDWGRIRIMGADARIIVDHCIIEKDRGGFLQFRASNCKVYVTNSILRNGGNRFLLQGNGRGIDARDQFMDTLIVRNTIIHNIIDRVFRSQGGKEPHNYVEFDHCTVFNHSGRHGAFQFGKALEVKVTNNLLINPIMMGTSPFYTDEQTQPDNEAHKIFTVDTLYENTSFSFASNNIFYTQDVLDFFESIDSVSRPAVYSDLILQNLGNDGTDGYFEDPVDLASVPMSILQYPKDLYADPNNEMMFDFVVEDIALQGTDRDNGNIFDFSTFDPCYDPSSVSASASTRGGAVGAVAFCANLSEEGVEQPDSLRYVLIEASDDPFAITDIFPVIMGDTTDTGERVSNRTIYQLQNGKVYITSGRMVNKPEWPLHIEAVDLDDTVNKPVLTRIPNASGTYPDIMRPEGDVTLKNLWIISGDRGADEQHDWGRIRIMGTDVRVIVDHCIIEKDRGGFLQFRGSGAKVYVTNSVLRNGGNRFLLQGNGRGIDARDQQLDTLIVRNTVIHNIIDRVFRSQGGKEPHNYIEFDHCTVFNQSGRHGAFQFGKALTVKITNNVLSNPIMMGTSPFYTDEQTQPDNDSHKVFTIDTLYDGTNFTFASNNIFYTQDVLDLYASNDSVSRVAVYSDLIMQRMGNDGSGTYFEEELTFTSVPMTILQYVKDLYADPNSEMMFDFVVEDIALQGTDRDNGNIFDFSTFDPCYSSSAISATAATDGSAIGAVGSCSLLTSLYEPTITSTLNLQSLPNPIFNTAVFSYELNQTSFVRLSIYDFTGKHIATLVEDEQGAGVQRINWTPANNLSKGMYVARLQTSEGEMSLKLILQ